MTKVTIHSKNCFVMVRKLKSSFFRLDEVHVSTGNEVFRVESELFHQILSNSSSVLACLKIRDGQISQSKNLSANELKNTNLRVSTSLSPVSPVLHTKAMLRPCWSQIYNLCFILSTLRRWDYSAAIRNCLASVR